MTGGPVVRGLEKDLGGALPAGVRAQEPQCHRQSTGPGSVTDTGRGRREAVTALRQRKSEFWLPDLGFLSVV